MTCLVRLRPVLPEDESQLYALYVSTRQEEMVHWGWSPEQQEAFLRMQFRAQRLTYQAQHPQAVHQMILVDEEPAGRLMTARTSHAWILVDIALFPRFRGNGIGTALLRSLQEMAASAGLPISLHVQKSNPAQHLYRRLGFEQQGEDDLYLAMQWRLATGTEM